MYGVFVILLNNVSAVYADDALPDMPTDVQLVSPPSYSYISPNSYIQNPYYGQAMGRTTQILTESQINATAGEGVWSRLFTDGTYNAAVAGSVANLNNSYNSAIGGYLFGQSGRIGGFSVGGLVALQTPQTQSGNYLGYIYSTNIAELSQAYVEYQFSDIVQADIGRIALNSPWMNSANPSTTAYITYQGGVVNVQPFSSLLLTGIAINDMGNPAGFHPYTLYDSSFGYPIETTAVTSGAIVLGAQWSPTASYNLNLWGYQFYDYADMFYLDNKYTWTISSDFNIALAGQFAIEAGQGDNVLNNPQFTPYPYGSIGSNLLGVQFALNYGIWGLTLGFDSVFGAGSYGNGGLVSPYTYQVVSDPLYTTAQFGGMIEKASAGNAYKIAPSLTLLDKNLTIIPQYAYYATSAVPDSQEFDLTAQYSIPQIRGLSLDAAYSYVQSSGNNPIQPGDTINAVQMFVQYLY